MRVDCTRGKDEVYRDREPFEKDEGEAASAERRKSGEEAKGGRRAAAAGG